MATAPEAPEVPEVEAPEVAEIEVKPEVKPKTLEEAFARMDKQSGLIGKLNTQIEKLLKAKEEVKPQEVKASKRAEHLTPAEEELAALRAEVKALTEKDAAKESAALDERLENAIYEHLSGKLTKQPKRVIRLEAKAQVAEFKKHELPIAFGDGDKAFIFVGEGEKQVSLATHLDAFLAGEGKELISKPTPASDGLVLGGRAALSTKRSYKDSHGATVVEPIEVHTRR